MDFEKTIVNNIRKIMNDRGLKQATIAGYMQTSPSQFSKILTENVHLNFEQLSNLATKLSLREIDIITYPDIYTKKETKESDETDAVLQIKLKKEKREQVLRLIFGDHDIEIFNK